MLTLVDPARMVDATQQLGWVGGQVGEGQSNIPCAVDVAGQTMRSRGGGERKHMC